MATINWGPWSTTTKGAMRVGVELISTQIRPTMTQVTYTARLWTETSVTFKAPGDAQELAYSGSFGSGTIKFTNTQAAGTRAMRGTVSKTYAYAPDSYGRSPASWYISAKLNGVSIGVAPSVTHKFVISPRPFLLPKPVYQVWSKRISDTTAEVHWTNKMVLPSSPYQRMFIQRSVNGGAWQSAATLTWTPLNSQLWTDKGLKPNQKVTYRLRAFNSSGGSTWTEAYYALYTTPAAPPSLTAQWTVNTSGTPLVRLFWENKVGWGSNNYSIRIERTFAPAGSSTWSGWQTFTLADGRSSASLPAGTAKVFDANPPQGRVAYRLQVNTPETQANPSGSVKNAALYSAWVQSATLSTPTIPKAPTPLSPPSGTYVPIRQVTIAGTPRDAADVRFEWSHNPNGDGSTQTDYEVRWSPDGKTWTTQSPEGTSSDEFAEVTTLGMVGTVYWQVRTKGVHPDWGPWSASRTIILAPAPVITITDPLDGTVISARPVPVTWDYMQANGFPEEAFNGYIYRVGVNGEPDVLVESTSVYSTAQQWLVNQPLENDRTYRVEIKARAKGMWSNTASTTFTAHFLPPANVHLQPVLDCASGSAVVTVTADKAEDGYDETLRRNMESRWDYGSFETSIAGLVAARGTLAQATPTPAPTVGAKALEITVSTAGGTYVNMGAATDKPCQPGQNVQVSYDFLSNGPATCGTYVYFYKADGTLVGGPYASQAVTLGAWTRVAATFTVPAEAYYVRPSIAALPTTTAVGSVVYVDGYTLEIRDTAPSNPGSTYVGAPTKTLPETAAVDFVDVQRRIDGGEWVTIHAGAQLTDLTATVLDLLPTLNGLNEYRVLISSLAGGYTYSWPVPLRTLGFDQCEFAFVNWGDQFELVERASCDPKISEKSGRARAAHAMIGRQRPILMVGDQRTRSISASFSLNWVKTVCLDGFERELANSPREEWLRMGEDASLVCYRDWTGRRMFGMISDVSESDLEGALEVCDISFDLLRTDYREGVVPRGNVDVAWDLAEVPAPYDPEQDPENPVPENPYLGVNLAPYDGSFEVGVAGWQVHNATLVEDTAKRPAQGGLKSARITATKDGTSYIMETLDGTDGHTVAPLQDVTLGYEYLDNVASSARSAVLWYDSAGAMIGGVNLVEASTVPGEWTRVVLRQTAPATAAYFRVMVANAVRTVGHPSWVDNVSVELGNTSGDWFSNGA